MTEGLPFSSAFMHRIVASSSWIVWLFSFRVSSLVQQLSYTSLASLGSPSNSGGDSLVNHLPTDVSTLHPYANH
ncbi:hypothetical protein B0H34DRAFT_720713 [Crassisporium funariophilum]|nr:hypothetical protein B0H34DRAFT_720713 [Crassisporium funariophilum]